MAKAKGPSQRQLRVGELIRKHLAEIFAQGDINDDLVNEAGVTITEVQATPDLRLAKAYVRPLFDCDQAALLEALNRHRRYIRGRLTPKLELKYMPDIKFEHDASSDHAARIDTLLRSTKVRRDLAGPDEG